MAINIRGREWTNPQGEVKYFNSITGWKLEKVAENTQEPVKANASTESVAAPSNENPFADDEDDDLPF